MLRRVFFIIILLFLFLGSFVFCTNKAFLYSPYPTHYNLTQEMVKLYNLTYDPDITIHQAELILKGSIDEDTLPRPAFHLYDPIYNRAPFGVYTAKQWALDSSIQKSAIQKFASILFSIFRGEFRYHGDYSWPASVKYFIEDDLDKAYYGLGHILHLIEDMDMPAHTRNDHHVLGDPYEQWAGNSTTPNDYDWAEKLYNQGYYPKYLYSLGQAFDELAKYSNKYFFSKDTILHPDYEWPKVVKTRKEDLGHFMQRDYLIGKDENENDIRLAYKDYYRSNWREISPSKKKIEDVYFINRDDQKLNHGYWERLAPKAIIYGAGVIRLFMKDIEWEKEKLAHKRPEPSFFQKAQTFIKNILGIKQENKEEELKPIAPSEPWPLPKPGGLPKIETIIQPSVPSSIEPIEPEKVSSDEELDKNLTDEEQEIESSEEKQEETKYGGSVSGSPSGSTPREEQQQPEEKQEEEEEEQGKELEPHIVINEIQIRDNEFVELYNSIDIALSLASYSFCYYSSARDWNDPYRNKEFPATASISAGGYYLIGILNFPESGGNPDADWQIKTNEGNPYSSGQLSNTGGSIAIFPWDPSEKTASEAHVGAIDVVAWGEVEIVKEGTSFQETIGIDKSIQRKDNGQDTNDNSIDFELQKIPSPTNSKGETRIPGTYIPDDTIISENTTWTIAGSPYYIELNANQWPIIEESATLTIEPGVVVMPRGGNYTFLEIRGKLIAEGTEDEKIVFTSIKDSDYGGEGGAAAGDWVRLLFTSTSTNSSIKNAIFRYGSQKTGLQNLDTEMIKVDGGSIEMDNVVMEYSESRGIHLIDSNSKIENSTFKDSEVGMLIEGSLDASVINNCSFENNSELGLGIKYGALPIIKNNHFSDNGEVAGASDQGAIMIHSAYPEFENNQTSNNVINGILVHWQSRFEQDATWQADLPYILVSNAGEYPTVASGSTLTLEPEIILKPYSKNRTALLVEGTLIAKAASDSEIVFTSLKDDSFSGDTNNDGDITSPAIGDWKDIKFVSGSKGVFEHVFLYYGTGAPPVVIEQGASVEMGSVDYEP